MILPETASANAGLCGQCAKIPESLRRTKQEFERKLASGLVFSPSPEERNSAKRPVAQDWRLEPEFYKDSETQSLWEVLDLALTKSKGYVFLISESGVRLNLTFNELYGVCEYQDEKSGHYLYSYTTKNLSRQVANDLHLIQACPCCGEGMLWYPSRFHMPREIAFEVYCALALADPKNEQIVEWFDCGDISYTARGRG